jgi:GLPGLI family protein
MKNYIFIFILSFGFAQIKDNKGIIYYSEYKSINQGAKNGKELIGNLMFDYKNSFYSSEQKDSLNILIKKPKTDNQTNDIYKNPDGEGGIIYNGNNDDDGRGYQISTLKDSVKSYFVWHSPTQGNIHYIKEKREKINWKLNHETKKIGKFNCLKATGKFRGREYIAWYTLEIPVPFGPWKLQGLPGLILEAYNENQEIYFCAKKIEYPFLNKIQVPTNILKLDGYKWITYSESLPMMRILLKEVYEKSLLIVENLNLKTVTVKKSTLKDIFYEFEE